MPNRIHTEDNMDNTMEDANIELQSLGEKARENRLRALVANNRGMANIFV